jgi:hypothetical protein
VQGAGAGAALFGHVKAQGAGAGPIAKPLVVPAVVVAGVEQQLIGAAEED